VIASVAIAGDAKSVADAKTVAAKRYVLRTNFICLSSLAGTRSCCCKKFCHNSSPVFHDSIEAGKSFSTVRINHSPSNATNFVHHPIPLPSFTTHPTNHAYKVNGNRVQCRHKQFEKVPGVARSTQSLTVFASPWLSKLFLATLTSRSTQKYRSRTRISSPGKSGVIPPSARNF
jgi:hypothetical protein